MLTYSYWKPLAEGFDTNYDGTIDLDDTPTLPCVLDNHTYFYKDGTGSFNQGATKCNPGHDQERSFKWFFVSGDSVINIDQQEYKILSLTANNLIICYEDIFTLAPNSYVLKFMH
jgi:hypothetical protein